MMAAKREGEGVVIRGSTKCQECGNQAKRGCSFMRCRTCCNNKGFECETHVKSTWVPVDHRRKIHQDLTPQRKKHKNPGEELKFPASMSLTATFRCVRVRSMDALANEYAYHTCVSIGGHVFSGLLYDQGPDTRGGGSGGGGSSDGDDSYNDSGLPLPLPQQNNNNNLMNIASTTQNHDGATMASLISSNYGGDNSTIFSPTYPLLQFPLTTNFMPGMPYFSHPKP
ncbi:protein SHI RELATED SEQUENCE 3 [Senna tora]|uniref:Protein SHI RELATED SEQUENCE 3 n=1 Tax=Senna tora TaxID=362788 RepID=A0A835CJ61_9FABA|nr:protein SHI RELATED SEQUENCE 3 [Senna tora]